MERLIIIGAGGHGKVAADIAIKLGTYKQIAFIDDNAVAECMDLPVLGGMDCAKEYISGSAFFVAVGNSRARERIMRALTDMGATVISLIHPGAIIGYGVEVGAGSMLAAGSVICPSVKIGRGVIVNTKGSVDHDCTVGDFSHVSVGATVAGSVRIGAHTWIGAGATVINNVEITDNCMIGAGAVVVKSISESGTYVGVPAKRIES